MKNIKLTILACVASFGLSATGGGSVTEDFNHGNECVSWLNCWRFCYVDVWSNCNYTINSGSERPQAVTSKFPGWCDWSYVASPYTAFDGTGTVDFTHRISYATGKYLRLRAYLIDDQGHLGAKIFDHKYRSYYQNVNGNPTHNMTESIPVTWTGTKKVVWYWTGAKTYARGLLDDISISGTYAADPWNWCKPVSPCVDSDGDGCCDSEDDFPNDPSKCTESFTPGEDAYNTIAYEDLWPSTGDFDFNDKVIDRYTIRGLDANGDVTEIEHRFVLRAAGAGFMNGFGVQMPGIPSSAVASVTGGNNPGNYTVLNPNGTEAGQTDAVVIVWENWNDIVTRVINGTFFNTMPVAEGGGQGFSDTVAVTITFNSPQNPANIEFDPFLIRNGVRDREIHLPWFEPTDKVDTTLFRINQDSSAFPNPGNNYVDADNIPWAIYTPLGTFDWPKEVVDIKTAHFFFDDWAMSNGALYPDWYQDKPGYRDASKLY